MKLTDDALVAVCLCTRLGRGPHVVPLAVREWTDLVLELHREHQTTPSSLIDNPRTERIEDLLRGLASVGLELERLRSNGVWVLTRGDGDYPRLWKRVLGAEAPPVLFGAGPRAALTANLVAIIGARKPDEIESDVTDGALAAVAGSVFLPGIFRRLGFERSDGGGPSSADRRRLQADETD